MIPRGSAPHAAPLATLHCDSPHKVQCLQLVPTQNPHVAESLGGRGSDCAGQIPAAAATDSRFRVTLDQNLSRWDPCHWLLRACCAFQRSQRALAVLAMLHAGSETNCWRWDGSVVVRRLSRLWWANNPPLVADSRDRTHAGSRTLSASGQDSEATAQSSQRWLSQGLARANARYTTGGHSGRKGQCPVPRPYITWPGTSLYRYCISPYVPYIYTPYRYL